MPCASGRFEFPETSLIEELNSIDKSAAPGKRPGRKGGVRLLAALGNRHNMRGAPGPVPAERSGGERTALNPTGMRDGRPLPATRMSAAATTSSPREMRCLSKLPGG